MEELTRKHSQPLTPLGGVARETRAIVEEILIVKAILIGVVGGYASIYIYIMLIAVGEDLFDWLSSKYQAIKTMLK